MSDGGDPKVVGGVIVPLILRKNGWGAIFASAIEDMRKFEAERNAMLQDSVAKQAAASNSEVEVVTKTETKKRAIRKASAAVTLADIEEDGAKAETQRLKFMDQTLASAGRYNNLKLAQQKKAEDASEAMRLKNLDATLLSAEKYNALLLQQQKDAAAAQERNQAEYWLKYHSFEDAERAKDLAATRGYVSQKEGLMRRLGSRSGPLARTSGFALGVGAGGMAVAGTAAYVGGGMNRGMLEAEGNAGMTANQSASFRSSVMGTNRAFDFPDIIASRKFIAEQGFGTGANANKVFNPIADAAMATGGNLQEMTQAITAGMKNFGVTADGASKFVNSIYEESTTARVAMSDLVNKMVRGMEAAGASGLNPYDVIATMGALTKGGDPAGMAGADTFQLLQSVLNPTDKVKALVSRITKKTGVDLEEGFTEPGLQQIGLIGLSDRVRDAAAKMGMSPSELARQLVPSRRGSGAMQILSSDTGNPAAHEILANQGKQGNLQARAAAVQDTVPAQVQLLKNDLVLLATEFSDAGMGAQLKSIIGAVSSWLKMLHDMPAVDKKRLTDAIEIVSGVLLGAGVLGKTVQGGATLVNLYKDLKGTGAGAALTVAATNLDASAVALSAAAEKLALGGGIPGGGGATSAAENVAAGGVGAKVIKRTLLSRVIGAGGRALATPLGMTASAAAILLTDPGNMQNESRPGGSQDRLAQEHRQEQWRMQHPGQHLPGPDESSAAGERIMSALFEGVPSPKVRASCALWLSKLLDAAGSDIHEAGALNFVDTMVRRHMAHLVPTRDAAPGDVAVYHGRRFGVAKDSAGLGYHVGIVNNAHGVTSSSGGNLSTTRGLMMQGQYPAAVYRVDSLTGTPDANASPSQSVRDAEHRQFDAVDAAAARKEMANEHRYLQAQRAATRKRLHEALTGFRQAHVGDTEVGAASSTTGLTPDELKLLAQLRASRMQDLSNYDHAGTVAGEQRDLGIVEGVNARIRTLFQRSRDRVAKRASDRKQAAANKREDDAYGEAEEYIGKQNDVFYRKHLDVLGEAEHYLDTSGAAWDRKRANKAARATAANERQDDINQGKNIMGYARGAAPVDELTGLTTRISGEKTSLLDPAIFAKTWMHKLGGFGRKGPLGLDETSQHEREALATQVRMREERIRAETLRGSQMMAQETALNTSLSAPGQTPAQRTGTLQSMKKLADDISASREHLQAMKSDLASLKQSGVDIDTHTKNMRDWMGQNQNMSAYGLHSTGNRSGDAMINSLLGSIGGFAQQGAQKASEKGGALGNFLAGIGGGGQGVGGGLGQMAVAGLSAFSPMWGQIAGATAGLLGNLFGGGDSTPKPPTPLVFSQYANVGHMGAVSRSVGPAPMTRSEMPTEHQWERLLNKLADKLGDKIQGNTTVNVANAHLGNNTDIAATSRQLAWHMKKEQVTHVKRGL